MSNKPKISFNLIRWILAGMFAGRMITIRITTQPAMAIGAAVGLIIGAIIGLIIGQTVIKSVKVADGMIARVIWAIPTAIIGAMFVTAFIGWSAITYKIIIYVTIVFGLLEFIVASWSRGD